MKIPSSERSLERIVNYINKTPLIKSDRLSSKNQNVFLKLENFGLHFQIFGSPFHTIEETFDFSKPASKYAIKSESQQASK